MLRPLNLLEANRYNINYLYSIGVKANKNAGREFVAVGPALGAGKIVQIKIFRKFNLGNHIRQVINAVRIAERLDADRVVLPADSFFTDGLVGNVSIVRDAAKLSSNEKELVGDFFYFEKFGFNIESLERARIIRGLRNLVQGSQHFPRESPTTLTVHIRGGDSLSANPHPLYAPPPLVFFMESISKSLANKVVFVCQDKLHPYLKALHDFCRARDIEVEVQSSSLELDFARLMSASNLCLSQGTLALAAAWLTGNNPIVYAFMRDDDECASFRDLGLRVHHAKSQDEPGRWMGTPEQVSHLMEIGVSKIEWESISS